MRSILDVADNSGARKIAIINPIAVPPAATPDLRHRHSVGEEATPESNVKKGKFVKAGRSGGGTAIGLMIGDLACAGIVGDVQDRSHLNHDCFSRLRSAALNLNRLANDALQRPALAPAHRPRLDNRDGIADLRVALFIGTMNFDVRRWVLPYSPCRTCHSTATTMLFCILLLTTTPTFQTFAPLRILESGNWVIG